MNPFLPYESELYVADLGAAHVCLLNKYPVLPHHALIVTRDFEPQESPLGAADFAAAWSVLCDFDGLVFYNAGPEAGASQPHKHLQVVPLPLGAAAPTVPIEPWLAAARFDRAIGRVPALPFLHGFARLRDDRGGPDTIARVLHGLYRKLAAAFGCDQGGRPYNLLVTKRWMLLVPRSRAGWQGVPVNALGFAGALLAKDDAQRELLRTAGPLTALREVAIAAPD